MPGRRRKFTHDGRANAKAALDPFSPTPSLLVKLGSIVVHAEEMLAPGGHAFDRIAITSLLADDEVQAWLASARAGAFLPVKRSERSQ
jgi:hypothetical protein